MTPINNNQMSEELREKIKNILEGNIYYNDEEWGFDRENLDLGDSVDDLLTLINRERAEAVKQFRKELVKLYPAFPNEQTLANIEFWKTLMDKAEEYLSNERGK